MADISFLERIAATAAAHADRPAWSCTDREITYGELLRLAQAIRQQIVQAGFGTSPRIGILTADDATTYASILAVWSLGAAYVPLNARNPAERNGRIIDQAGIEVVLTCRAADEWGQHLPRGRNTPLIISSRDIEAAADMVQLRPAAPDALAYVFFTSGSTGAPKGVPITHRNVSAFMEMVLSDRPYTHDDRVLQMFELTFDLSVVSILLPWSVGACCCVVPEKGISWMNILQTLSDQGVTVALMVPSVLPYMQRFFDEVRLPALRLSQFCGEALMQDMVSAWSQCVPNAVIENVYGPTEATIYCTRYNWDRERAEGESVNGIVPIGTALAGTTTVVVDPEGRVCRPDERGELCLAGDQVMSGYWQDPAKSREVFVDLTLNGRALTAYRTGDIVYQNEKSNLIYCGRKDSQVKIDGHRVELGEIEYFARQFIDSSAAAVIVEADATGVSRLHLYVGGEGIEKAGLERHLKENLPAYMQPSTITVLPELPLNLNGKIDRPSLARLGPG